MMLAVWYQRAMDSADSPLDMNLIAVNAQAMNVAAVRAMATPAEQQLL